MRFYNLEYEIEYLLSEDNINVFYIENREAFAHMVRDIWQQSSGKEGSWLLSSEDENINISKKLLCILNPLSIDCNDKRLIKELYQNLNQYLMQEKTDVITEINSKIIDMIDMATKQQPFLIDFDLEINLTDLFKIYNVKFESDSTNMLENVCSYIKLWHRVAGMTHFVFVDLKSYLSEQELMLLYETVLYEKVYVFLIESRYESKLEKEQVKIYDIDKCIIDC